LAIYAKDYARLHRKSRKRSTFTLGYRKSELKLKPITGFAERGDPSVDISALRDLVHELTYQLGLNDGDYVHPTGQKNPPKPTLQARARADGDPYLQLRAHVLLQALEDIGANPGDPDLREWFFSERFYRRYDPAVVGTDFIPAPAPGSPMWSIQQMSWMFHEIDQDGIFSLRTLCYSLGLDIRRVRETVASALGGKAIRRAIQLANAGARARRASRHDPRPLPYHKGEAKKYAPDQNQFNPWSINYFEKWEPPALWDEILRSPQPSLDEMLAEEAKVLRIRFQNCLRARKYRKRLGREELNRRDRERYKLAK